MNELLQNKLNDLLITIDNSDIIKEIKDLKKDIYNDKDLAKKINEIKAIDNIYLSRYLELKKEIINEPKVKRFHELEDIIYFEVLTFNKKLEKLFNKKGCFK